MCYGDERANGLRRSDGHFGQRPAVDFDARFMEAFDKTVIREAERTTGSVDPDDP